ncbi:hypothetical protein ACFV0O_03735 [Kitasatospora sp. NPDC059577]|uniref:hypothetical protein n=1 Tax=Kitasatospora sp. NPDC059577 TaxID=3346873 RepID=UPI0036ABE374
MTRALTSSIDGYLLRHPLDVAKPVLLPAEPVGRIGMTLYGLRHFFASSCLSHNIPITDVAEWMGHRSIDVTFKIYWHLMPGSIGHAAMVLDLGLAA